MSDGLRLEPEALVALGHDLRAVATEFDSAQVSADYVADAVGHPGLAGKVRHFANGWDDRRAKMIDSIASLAEASQGIGDSFMDLDTELRAAIVGEK